jgi:hypothetical protein
MTAASRIFRLGQEKGKQLLSTPGLAGIGNARWKSRPELDVVCFDRRRRRHLPCMLIFMTPYLSVLSQRNVFRRHLGLFWYLSQNSPR